ncbi:hypothetical protein IQ250_13150 [Pseudanabaenaceae cyanobacterium LEGE 13415]|nr:hypothetical protein [Pseudanabaenaceae cyanobacterium LEGE 13415]
MPQRIRPIRFGISSIVLLMALFSSVQLAQAQTTKIPDVIKNCLPTQTRPVLVRSELIAQTRSQGKTYYLLSAVPASGNGIDLVISTHGNRCTQEFFNASGDTVSLTSVVGQEVSRKLAFGRYQHEIEQLGRRQLQQGINQAAASNGVLYPEDIWALKQLGFSIPATVRVTE